MKTSNFYSVLTIFVILFLTGCSIQNFKDSRKIKKSYDEVEFSEVELFEKLEQVYSNDGNTLYLAYKGNNKDEKPRYILKKEFNSNAKYFLFSKNVLFLNENLIVPDLFFKYGNDVNVGIGLKADFDKRNVNFS